jgi:hypothetical protein
MGRWEYSVDDYQDNSGFGCIERTIELPKSRGCYCVKIGASIIIGWPINDLWDIRFYLYNDVRNNFRNNAELSLDDVPERLFSEICRDIEKYFFNLKCPKILTGRK